MSVRFFVTAFGRHLGEEENILHILFGFLGVCIINGGLYFDMDPRSNPISSQGDRPIQLQLKVYGVVVVVVRSSIILRPCYEIGPI